MVLQTILIPKEKFTLVKAKKWMRDNKYPIKKIHETTRFYRFRQSLPLTPKEKKQGDSYLLEKKPGGIRFIYKIKL